MRYHPTTLICVWIWLALVLPMLSLAQLGMVSVILLLLACGQQKAGLVRMLRRNRVLLLSILILYALMTPGDVLLSFFDVIEITREGLLSGGQQALRLLTLLAALVWLLGTLSAPDMLRGMLHLLYPLQRLGLDARRIAIRLALTLRYAGNYGSHKISDWHAEFLRVFDESQSATEAPVVMTDSPMRVADWLLLTIAVLLFILMRIGV